MFDKIEIFNFFVNIIFAFFLIYWKRGLYLHGVIGGGGEALLSKEDLQVYGQHGENWVWFYGGSKSSWVFIHICKYDISSKTDTIFNYAAGLNSRIFHFYQAKTCKIKIRVSDFSPLTK